MMKLLERFLHPRKTPRLIQMETVECGAAALGIVLGYHGKYIPLEELRETCGVSRDGLSFEEIGKAAKIYGMDSEVYEATVSDLDEMSLPVILFWDYDHFLVLEEFLDHKVYINDPRSGHVIISRKELEKSYSGLAMECKPNQSFVPSGKRQTILTRAFEKMEPFKKSLKYLFWVQMAIAILGLTIPVFAQIFIDQFFGPILPKWEWKFLGVIFGAVLLSGMMTWIQAHFLNYLQVRIAIRLSAEFLWRIIRLPVLFFSQRYGSELINRMNLNNQIGRILTRDIVLNTLNILLLSSYWIIMLFYNVSITLFAGVIALFNIALVWYIGKTRANSYSKLQQSEAKAVGISFDALEHIETMKGNAQENFFFSRIASSYTASINNAQEIGKKDVWLNSLSRISTQFSTIFILAFGSWEVIHGCLTVGKLIALQILYNFFLAPVTQLVRFSTEIQSVEVDLTRLDDVLKAKQDPFLDPRKEGVSDTKLKGDLSFRNVDFGYKKLEKPFIKKMNLQIGAGEMIGLTGPNGSGKSTLARLATCLFQPLKGEVLFDGKVYQEYTRDTLHRSMALVDQLVQFYPGSVRENLSLWNPEISDQEITEAMKVACVDEEIIALPEGIFTIMEEDALNFSGGQRQRLEIARIILKKPTFLILDEATNALDADVESRVLANIRSLGITTLLISHRLSTFKECDRILVLEEGQIVQDGSHEALARAEGPYKRILEFEIKKKL